VKRLKTVGVKELKNNLSAYLREVRSGTTVLVSDRDTIVAEIHEPYARSVPDEALNPLLLELAEAGLVSFPKTGKISLQVSPVKSPAGTSMRLLKEDREESCE
jgi:antitoxin (DNA-binding transcriptional repressor) of toxin-antitoxin stability system